MAQQQVILVTGASSGIGEVIARDLAKAGYFVYAAARRTDRLEAMRSSNILPLALDVTDEASISAAVEQIVREKGRVDVLVNNAGYAQYGVLEDVTTAEAQRQFDVNVFGLMAVTRAVLPIMRAQRSGTIINLSSVAGKVSTLMAGWYSASKHAVEALSDALRQEVTPFGIRVVILEPGSIATEFGGIALGELDRTTRTDAYRPSAASFHKMIASSYRNAPGPDVIGQVVVRALSRPNPRTRYALPNDSRMLIFLRGLLSDQIFDRLILSQLWR